MSQLSREDCKTIVQVVTSGANELPDGARALKTALRRIGREYARAGANYDGANEDGKDPEIRACGGLEPGEWIELGDGSHEVRRVTDTGIEIMSDGKWVWENVRSRTSPVVVVEPGVHR